MEARRHPGVGRKVAGSENEGARIREEQVTGKAQSKVRGRRKSW